MVIFLDVCSICQLLIPSVVISYVLTRLHSLLSSQVCILFLKGTLKLYQLPGMPDLNPALLVAVSPVANGPEGPC